jgi:hypothetical protein
MLEFHGTPKMFAQICGSQIARVAIFLCGGAKRVCVGPQRENLLHVTLLAAEILRWFRDFWKILHSLPLVYFHIRFQIK